MINIAELSRKDDERTYLTMPWPTLNELSVKDYPENFPVIGHELKPNDFNFVVNENGVPVRKGAEDLSVVFPEWSPGKEVVLVLCPHDDDGPIGAGNILLRLSLECRQGNAKVFFVSTTDGSQGYCSEVERQTIVGTRQNESLNCLRALGYPEETLLNLGFPDDSLGQYLGRRPALPWEPYYHDGHTGIENALTHVLRLTQPTRVLIPTGQDLHLDHQFLKREVDIANV